MNPLKKRLAGLISRKIKDFDSSLLEVPPDPNMGDFALPCFFLAKRMKRSPQDISGELASGFKKGAFLQDVRSNGPYLNFFISKSYAAKTILSDINNSQGKVSHDSGFEKKRIMVEYSSPNTNKPLHLGHVRNNVLGKVVSLLLASQGAKVIQSSLVNDRGIHICKSMLAYLRWGRGRTPKSQSKKGDHFVGDFYVMYSKQEKKDPKIEEEAKRMLLAWESGDPKTRKLWKLMNAWTLQGFKETYERMGIRFQKLYFESELYTHGKEIIKNAYQKRIVQKDDSGALYMDLSKDGLDKKILLRSDGTSVYITQDIYLAKKKFDDFRLDESIYVVASEQNYHFRVLFKILERLGFGWAGNLKHLSYGMVYLPEGKMKSREGTVVDADDILDELVALAQKEVRARYKDLSQKEIQKRSQKIAIAALYFYMARTDLVKDMTYDPKGSISFQGETGPYIQYTCTEERGEAVSLQKRLCPGSFQASI
jgi:arginyl-tRNA synthetase